MKIKSLLIVMLCYTGISLMAMEAPTKEELMNRVSEIAMQDSPIAEKIEALRALSSVADGLQYTKVVYLITRKIAQLEYPEELAQAKKIHRAPNHRTPNIE